MKLSSNSLKTLLFIVFGVLLFNFVNNPLVVSVTGQGEYKVKADYAQVSLTVSEIGGSPVEATLTLEEKIKILKEDLRNKGFEDKFFESKVKIVKAPSSTKQNFIVSKAITAKTKQLDNLNVVIASFSERNNIVVSMPILGLEYNSKAEEKALEQALKNSKKNIKKASGKKLMLFRKLNSVTVLDNSDIGILGEKNSQLNSSDEAENNFKNDTITIVRTVRTSYRVW